MFTSDFTNLRRTASGTGYAAMFPCNGGSESPRMPALVASPRSSISSRYLGLSRGRIALGNVRGLLATIEPGRHRRIAAHKSPSCANARSGTCMADRQGLRALTRYRRANRLMQAPCSYRQTVASSHRAPTETTASWRQKGRRRDTGLKAGSGTAA